MVLFATVTSPPNFSKIELFDMYPQMFLFLGWIVIPKWHGITAMAGLFVVIICDETKRNNLRWCWIQDCNHSLWYLTTIIEYYFPNNPVFAQIFYQKKWLFKFDHTRNLSSVAVWVTEEKFLTCCYYNTATCNMLLYPFPCLLDLGVEYEALSSCCFLLRLAACYLFRATTMARSAASLPWAP